MTLKERVQEALSNAYANGYTFKGWTAEQIADDMLYCSADLENEDRAAVVAVLRELGR